MMDEENRDRAVLKSNGSADAPQMEAVEGQPGNAFKSEWAAVWTMCAMSLGFGVFNVPYNVYQIGLVPGSICILLFGYFANFAQARLLDVACANGVASYDELTKLALGPCGKVLMDIITVVTTFIANCAYMSSNVRLLTALLFSFLVDIDMDSSKYPGGIDALSDGKRTVLFTILLVMVVPLCMGETIGGLSKISTVSVWSVLIAVAIMLIKCVVIFVRGCKEEKCGSSIPAFASPKPEMLEFMGALAFTYSIIFALFPVLQEIPGGASPQNLERMKSIVCRACMVCTMVYFTMGVVGALAFGTAVEAIALYNLPMSDAIVSIMSLVLCVVMTLLFPVIGFPTIQSLGNLFCKGTGCAPNTPMGRFRRPVSAVGIAGMVLLFDTVVPTKAAFALCGSLGLAVAAYIMPCIIYLRLDREHGPWHWTRLGTMATLLLGLVLLFGSTPMTLISLGSASPSGPKATPLKQALCGAAVATEGLDDIVF